MSLQRDQPSLIFRLIKHKSLNWELKLCLFRFSLRLHNILSNTISFNINLFILHFISPPKINTHQVIEYFLLLIKTFINKVEYEVTQVRIINKLSCGLWWFSFSRLYSLLYSWKIHNDCNMSRGGQVPLQSLTWAVGILDDEVGSDKVRSHHC